MTRPSMRRYGRALSFALLLALFAPASLHALTGNEQSVVMLSDIHFDPFHDPAKFAQLRKSSVTGWPSILDSPDSPTQAVDFEALQKTCNARGEDTSSTLLKSSVHAAQEQNPKPLFLTVSGDLMAHQFSCRFKTLAPAASSAEQSAFAAKTVSFVVYEIWLSFPNTPTYMTLGNNDSGCGDYEEDPNSSFMKNAAISLAASSKDPHIRWEILREFSRYGNYNVALPKPMNHTRLVVLQDIFQSKKYGSCSGTNSDLAANAQVVWLRKQLSSARKSHQTVWVMTHIPPGVDAYSTVKKSRNVCGGDAPENFLASDALLKAITDYGDVVRLTLLGHTHMDELRIYKATNSESKDTYIPGKIVPSISPVDGNNPAFLIASVDPYTATLEDYTAYAAGDATGIDTTWKKEYRFSDTYQLVNLSGAALHRLISGMVDDKSGSSPQSASYQSYFYAGQAGTGSMALHVAWPTYTCAISEGSAADFHSCVCPAKPENAATTAPTTVTP